MEATDGTDGTGSINFSSVPFGAEIYIDGADQGVKTPYTILSVPAGIHSYALKSEGYNDATGTVNVIQGQTPLVTAVMIRAGAISSITTGGKIMIGILVAGVLGIIAYKATKKEPKPSEGLEYKPWIRGGG